MIPITSNPDNSQRFFHFPIYCLRDCGMKPTEKEREAFFQRVIAFVLIEVSNHIESDWDDAVIDAKVQSFIASNPSHRTLIKSASDRAFAAAHEFVRVTCPTWQHRHTREVHRSIVGAYGQSRVSLNAEYFWECKSDSSMNWREFAILCGVYGAIGRDACKCIKYERIAAMAAGFSSEREIVTAQKEHGWKVKTFTQKQVRATIEKLERRNFFLTASPDGRRKYYTVQLRPFERLAAWLAKAAQERQKRNDSLSQTQRTAYIKQLISSPDTPK